MKFHTAPGSAQNGEGYLPLELIETLLDPQCALPAPYASSTSPLAPAPAVVADHSPVSQIPAPTCAARHRHTELRSYQIIPDEFGKLSFGGGKLEMVARSGTADPGEDIEYMKGMTQ